MAITTIEDALASMGQKLASITAISAVARQALQAGGKYTITIEVSENKNGAVVSMSGHPSAAKQSFGQLIKLE
jgi:hypothetical protein